MSEFNTFTGKTVDDAITEACRFFTTERDKLEVEIVSGGSTGIFGLVGKKKAQIKVRRRLDPVVAAKMREEACEAAQQKASEQTEAAPEAAAVAKPAAQQEQKPRSRDGRRQQRKPRDVREPNAQPAQGAVDESTDSLESTAEAVSVETTGQPSEGSEGRRSRSRSRRPRRDRSRGEQSSRQRDEAAPADTAMAANSAEASLEDDLPEGADQSPAPQELLDLAADIMKRLLTPILEQEPAMQIEGTASRVNVLIQDEEHSGLLIGREGQTLAALQYLANRIIVRRWESPVRLQVNTGEYREKQDDNLRKMALYLADKAKNLGRPQSTKPLSSYHRRVVHLTLQSDETIQTRSKGEGPMKRVIIVPRRPKPEAQPQS